MDGTGRWLDNVFIERLWRPLKQERVYLNAFDSVRDCQAGIGAWMDYYNRERTHSSFGDLTPGEAYETWRFPVRKPSDDFQRQHQSTSVRLRPKFAAELFKEWAPPLRVQSRFAPPVSSFAALSSADSLALISIDIIRRSENRGDVLLRVDH